ncbi:MAG: FKBP-type peptidyl-prolyl cis-trans isomerase [Buchnera aphidicola (Melaphis rhois)]
MFSFLLKGMIIAVSFLIFTVYSEVMGFEVNSLKVHTFNNKDFKSDSNRSSYALGVSLGHYINNFFSDQNKLGVYLNKNVLLSGIRDSIFFESKLSDSEISQILNRLEQRLLTLEKEITIKEAKVNAILGEKYIKKMLTKKNAQHSRSGLVFFIERKGIGSNIHKDDIVTVHYVGSFINGHEFDNSYKSGKPLSFPVNSVILGWQEGLKYIKKGGKIKLIVPPSLAYGEKKTPGIPCNSTLIFDIELIDIKSNV